MRVTAKPKYGEFTVDIPSPVIPQEKLPNGGLTPLFTQTVTIYNDIAATALSERRWDRHVVNGCTIQGGFVGRANGTVENIINSISVITNSVSNYVTPAVYAGLPVDERTNRYTVQIGDFVVFNEVDDVVTTAAQFAALQQKYKNNGIRVASATANINGMAVDNVTMSNVG